MSTYANTTNFVIKDYVDDEIAMLGSAVDTLWVTIATFLIFFMQTGFALLEAGTVRSKNTQNILLKNMLDTVITTVTWWLLGYAIAFGGTKNKFIGGNKYGGVSLGKASHYRDWFFQWSFSTTASTIVSGALAERTKLLSYSIFAFFFSILVYPFIVHWAWGGGWLSDWGDNPYVDFAGSGVIHLCGGVASLVGAAMVGPRIGRFEDPKGKEKKYPDSEWRPHSVPLVVTGTFILWFGWYGFNCGSALGITGDNEKIVSKVGLTTTVGGSAGGLAGLAIDFFWQWLTNKQFSFETMQVNVTPALTNGLLAGLVAVTAGCAFISAWGAFIIGGLGGILCYFSSMFVSEILKVDDPLDAFSVHGANGAWGVIATGLFHTDLGAFYGEDNIIGKQFVGVLAIAGWTAVIVFLIFLPLKMARVLRVPPHIEKAGLDAHEHGGSAYYIHKPTPDTEDPDPPTEPLTEDREIPTNHHDNDEVEMGDNGETRSLVENNQNNNVTNDDDSD